MRNREKTKGKPFNDGLLEFGQIKTKRDSTKRIIGEEFIYLGRLYFSIESIRQNDFEQYGGKNKTVDLKLSTYFTTDVEKTHKIKIASDVYEVTGIDPDADRIKMYWYLTKIGVIEDGIGFAKIESRS
ncbi:phage head closure protein [uncultured Vagococcus sp.]|uniref:phage head closure protein n=1 Tax=uncultured Vagococcus sp. TaxID=189676 RepID=UPI0028D73184|nr:phage head closure protein [uncultured Vagococcus sp.]